MSERHWARSPRFRVGVVVVGVVGVAAVAGAALVLFRGDDGPPERQELGGVVVERLWALDLPPRDEPDETFEGEVPRVAIDGDRAYVARHGRLQALDVASGERRWDADLDGSAGAIAAADGFVAVRVEVPFDPDQPDRPPGGLAVFDGDSGDRLWGEASLADEPFQPVIAGDMLVADLGEDGVQAFDLATGDTRWRQTGYSSPCWDGSSLTALGRGLVRLSAEDGQPVAGPAETGAAERVLCSPDAVVTVGPDEQATVHDPASLDVVGTLEHVRCCEVDQLLDGSTFVADTVDTDADAPECCPHTLVALDAATGEERWRYQTPVIGASALRYGRVGDVLVVADAAPAEGQDGEEPDGEEPDGDPLTQLLDSRGEPLGDVEHGIERPSVLATQPGGDTSSGDTSGGDTFVLGDDRQLVAFRVTPS